MWWNSAIGVFFVFYDDGSSTQWVTTQPVKYINIAELKAPAGGQLTGYYPDPVIVDAVVLEYPELRNPLGLLDYSQRLASTKWVQDKFASSGVLGQVTAGPGILLTPDPMAGDSTIALLAIAPPLAVPGPYGAANATAVFEINAYGQITSISNVAIPPVNSPTFTGIPAGPTAGPGTNTTQFATTQFVQAAIGGLSGIYAPINSPAFTGNPTAPTPIAISDSTAIATTEWVRDLVSQTAGRVLFSGADSFPTSSANFLWDITNSRLGLGIAPTQRLHVSGNEIITGTSNIGGLITGGAGLAITGAGSFTNFLSILTGTAPPAGGTQDLGWMISSTAHLGIIFGTGAPTASMNRGSLYIRSDGPPGPYVNIDGATGWTPVGGNVTVSDTAPVSPLDGQLWFNSALAGLYIRYNDGNTTQWVPATPAPIVPTTVQCPWSVRATTTDILGGATNIPFFRSPGLSNPVKDYDPQGVWDLTNNRFTAPSNGKYSFNLCTFLSVSVDAQVAVYIVHSNSGGTLIRQYAAAQNINTVGFGTHFHVSLELQMTSGDRVMFVVSQSGAGNLSIGAVPGSVGGMPASGSLTWAYGHRLGD